MTTILQIRLKVTNEESADRKAEALADNIETLHDTIARILRYYNENEGWEWDDEEIWLEEE